MAGNFNPESPSSPAAISAQPVLFALYMGWFQPTKPVEPARNNSFLDAPGGLGLARVLPHNPVTYIVVGPFKRKGSEKLFNSSSSSHRIQFSRRSSVNGALLSRSIAGSSRCCRRPPKIDSSCHSAAVYSIFPFN